MGVDIKEAVSIENLVRHNETIAQWIRLSGSPDERKAFDYAQDQLKSFGYTTQLIENLSLISYPGVSSLEVVDNSNSRLTCNGYSLSPSTPEGGVVGEVVYIGDGSNTHSQSLKGKILLSDGLATPGKSRLAADVGAIGHIHINGKLIHEMCISPVWGTPVPDTSHLLPTVPAVSVNIEDGDTLKSLLKSGPVSIRLFTSPYRQWTPIPTLIASLPGTEESKYVLFSGHIDSWHYGAMDNGSANATQLEVARLLAENRNSLRRGVRIAFWSGHSHGRYAGSTWYADTNWQDLHDNCVCHVNIDSVGAIHADVLEEAPTMAETFGFARDVIKNQTNVDLMYKRISRAGDQSFWGHGIPSMFISLSEQRIEDSPTSQAMGSLLGGGTVGGGLGWWWHTTEDTLDKIDPDNLLRDAKIYAEVLWRLCTDKQLPFDYAATAREMQTALEAFQGSNLNLSVTISRAEDLANLLDAVEVTEEDIARYNELLHHLGRLLTPVNYTHSGPYYQDLATGTGPLPGLSETSNLKTLDPESDDFQFLNVKLIRERNRIEHALISAIRKVEEFKQIQ